MVNKSRSALKANLLVVCQGWHWGQRMLFVSVPLSVSGHWYIISLCDFLCSFFYNILSPFVRRRGKDTGFFESVLLFPGGRVFGVWASFFRLNRHGWIQNILATHVFLIFLLYSSEFVGYGTIQVFPILDSDRPLEQLCCLMHIDRHFSSIFCQALARVVLLP